MLTLHAKALLSCYILLPKMKHIYKGKEMGYKDFGKEISFAASRLGEIWPLVSLWNIIAVSR